MTYPTRQKLPDAPSYTYAELLAQAKACLAQILTTGQDAYLGTRRMTQADLGKLQKSIDWLESKVTAEEGAGTGMIFNEVTRVR